MKSNTLKKPNQTTIKPITALLSVGLLLLLSNCGSNWDLLNQAENTEEQPLQKGEGFTHRQQTPEGAELIFTYEAGKGLQAVYQTASMPTPQAVREYPVLHDAAGSLMRMSKLEQEEAYLLSTAGRWEVSEAGVLRYRGMRGEGGMQSASSGDPTGAEQNAPPSYKLMTPSSEEVRKIQEFYQKSPQEGYEIAKVEKIRSRTMSQVYRGKKAQLDSKKNGLPFRPQWQNEPHPSDPEQTCLEREYVLNRLACLEEESGIPLEGSLGVKELGYGMVLRRK